MGGPVQLFILLQLLLNPFVRFFPHFIIFVFFLSKAPHAVQNGCYFCQFGRRIPQQINNWYPHKTFNTAAVPTPARPGLKGTQWPPQLQIATADHESVFTLRADIDHINLTALGGVIG
jgi:hypothetical protein